MIENNKKNIDNLKNKQLDSNKINNKKIEKSTRELIINLVRKIFIYQEKRIDIILTLKSF